MWAHKTHQTTEVLVFLMCNSDIQASALSLSYNYVLHLLTLFTVGSTVCKLRYDRV